MENEHPPGITGFTAKQHHAVSYTHLDVYKRQGYGNAKALTVSYVINQVLAAFGSTIIPYAIAAKALSLIHI